MALRDEGSARARYRSLADFGQLNPAERRLLAHAAGHDPDGDPDGRPDFCIIKGELPELLSAELVNKATTTPSELTEAERARIDAATEACIEAGALEFLRFLLLGGDGAAPVT